MQRALAEHRLDLVQSAEVDPFLADPFGKALGHITIKTKAPPVSERRQCLRDLRRIAGLRCGRVSARVRATYRATSRSASRLPSRESPSRSRLRRRSGT